MSTSTLNPVEKISRHLILLGYGESSRLHKTIVKWDNTNGSEWTVNRLKTLKSHFIHLVAKIPFDKEWIAYKGDLPKGPFGTLFKLGLKKPKRCLSVLNSYMAYTEPSIRKQQDVFSNISQPMSREVESFVNEEFHYITLDHDLMVKGRKALNRLTIENISPSISTALNTAKPFVGEDGEQQWLESLRYTSRRVLPTEAISCHFYEKNTFKVEPYGGELVVLPEKGNKARVIALPHAELQIMLKPLHDTINSILAQIPEDCTFDQLKGSKFAQQALKDGKTVHSVDLSAATDRFPLHLQMGLLRKLNSKMTNLNWASFFERSARLKWKTKYGDVVYGAGQPMGLYGSFALFALTHHAVLQTLCIEYQLEKDYRILGDDIVITNDRLATLYKDYMTKLGVSVSPSKTITSKYAAEFAGFLITKKSLIKVAKPISNGLTVDNMINYIKTLGSNPFKGSLKDIGDLLVYLPAPYGAGLNPRGLSVSHRLSFYQSATIEEKMLSCSNNIDNLIDANLREKKYWNPFLKSYDDSMESKEPDVILNYFKSVTGKIRTELSSHNQFGLDSRFDREHLLNNIDRDNSLAYAGSLGRNHRVVKPDEYIRDKLPWYKKLFGFYPWKT